VDDHRVSSVSLAISDDIVTRSIEAAPDVLLELHASKPDRYPAFLESAAQGGQGDLGRYDILFAFPQQEIAADNSGASFLSLLDAAWQAERRDTTDRALPFRGGWFVFLNYELANEIEPRLKLPATDRSARARALRIPAAVIVDHDASKLYVVAERAYAELVDCICEDIAALEPSPAESKDIIASLVEEEAQRYLSAVRRGLDYIGAGDIYQANLSRGWQARLSPGASASDVYRRLRRANPGPFNGSAHFGDFAVLSSSPERLIAVRDREVSTRPIAGTRPRSRDHGADAELARELRAHPKEQAEHVMLIDLERNDLGRICEAGSVEVDEFMTIESYAHVHHIVSNVRGRIRNDVTPGQCLAAVFPGGTITGCPKVRCMEIIAELEGVPRGAYTGSFGYLNRDGSMDFNILIRSLELRGDELRFRAGAGIVADSIPEHELAETRAKARGMLRALGVEDESR
jgi:anthranilate synthase component 1